MKADVLVIGAGLIGVATAYELVLRGYQTTLVEANANVASETSHANGALLTPAMSDPWNAPGVHRHLAASLFDSTSPMKLRFAALPSMAAWGVRFLCYSRPSLHAAATRASFALAKYSVDLTRERREALRLAYDASTRGTMKVFRDQQSMARSQFLANMLAPLGLKFAVLCPDAAVAFEPALKDVRDVIAGALWFPSDESGDPLKFCMALVRAFQDLGGVFKGTTHVQGLLSRGGAVTGIQLADRVITVERVVVAAGNGAAGLVRPTGLRLAICPVKGYSITFDHVPEPTPTIPVIDDALHAAVVPLGTRLRVAGTAEFAGPDRSLRSDRIENLRHLLRRIYPRLAQLLAGMRGTAWAGLRPMSADGLPFIGRTPLRGLYVNAGHGHLGWTLALGSAHVLADLIEGREPEVDPTPYRPVR